MNSPAISTETSLSSSTISEASSQLPQNAVLQGTDSPATPQSFNEEENNGDEVQEVEVEPVEVEPAEIEPADMEEYLMKWRRWLESVIPSVPDQPVVLQTCINDVKAAFEQRFKSFAAMPGPRVCPFNSPPQEEPILPSNEAQDSINLELSLQYNPELHVGGGGGGGENDHFDSPKLCTEIASVGNLDGGLQQPIHVDGDGLATEQAKSNNDEAGPSNRLRGAKRRKSTPVRRFGVYYYGA